MRRRAIVTGIVVLMAVSVCPPAAPAAEPASRNAPLSICPEFLPVCLRYPSDFDAECFFGEGWATWNAQQRQEGLAQLARACWRSAELSLYTRPARGGFRQLIVLIETELKGWEKLVILEDPASATFVVFARMPRGWTCFTNAGSWIQGYPAGRAVARKVDQKWMKQWMARFTESRLPQAALVSNCTYSGSLCLHVLSRGGEGWTCHLRDPTATAAVRRFVPVPSGGPAPDQPIRALRTIWRGVSQPFVAGRPKLPHVLLRKSQDAEYAALRNAYVAPAADLWAHAVDAPDFAPFGGKDKALAKLSKLTEVGGCAVGAAGTPGEFYLLSKAYACRATRADIERMLASGNPIVSAMGLTCAAASNLPDRVRLIAGQLARTDSFSQSPFGCIFEDISVGQYAMTMLLNPAYLDLEVDSPALVNEGPLGLYCLARDDLPGLQGEAGDILADRVESGALPLALPALRKAWPGSTDLLVIKALGRSAPSKKIEAFLMRCLEDRHLAREARLAAASALARHPTEAAEKTLRKMKDDIDTLAGMGVGQKLADQAERRATFWPYLRAHKQWRAAPDSEDLEGIIKRAVKSDAPMTPEEYTELSSRDMVLDLSAKLAAMARAPVQPWDSFADQAAGMAAVAANVPPQQRKKIRQAMEAVRPVPVPELPAARKK